MNSFLHAKRLLDSTLQAMQSSIEGELRIKMIFIAKEAGLRNRTIKFVDAMGSTSISVSARMGGEYIISLYNGVYRRILPKDTFSYANDSNFPLFAEWIHLIEDYEEATLNLFAVNDIEIVV